MDGAPAPPAAPAQPPAVRRPLWARLQALSSKPPMVVSLAFLLLLGVWRPALTDLPGTLLRWPAEVTLLWRAILILAIYSALDLTIGYWQTQKWILPSSAWVSGLILSTVLAPSAPWSVTIAAPILASLSKHFLRFKKRHVLNPAAFALVTLSIARSDPGLVSWWAASWGPLALWVVAASGLVTIIRVKRWKTALAFFLVYGILGSLLISSGSFLPTLIGRLWDGTTVFFATVMLIEPVTTAYSPARLRAIFGGLVGLLAVLSLPLGLLLPLPDPFLVPLLVGNLIMTLVSVRLRRV